MGRFCSQTRSANGYLAAIKVEGRDRKPLIVLGDEDPVKVVILSEPTFDALSSVNISTLTFGKTGAEKSLIRCERKGIDVTHDGLADLVCLFDSGKTALKPGHREAILAFSDNQETPYQGSEAVYVIGPCKENHHWDGEHRSNDNDCDHR